MFFDIIGRCVGGKSKLYILRVSFPAEICTGNMSVKTEKNYWMSHQEKQMDDFLTDNRPFFKKRFGSLKTPSYLCKTNDNTEIKSHYR